MCVFMYVSETELVYKREKQIFSMKSLVLYSKGLFFSTHVSNLWVSVTSVSVSAQS